MLGDIINGVDPRGCVQILQAWAEKNAVKLSCIKGNAEAYLLTPDREALSIRKEDWNKHLLELIQWFEDRLPHEDLAWIGTFPAALL